MASAQLSYTGWFSVKSFVMSFVFLFCAQAMPIAPCRLFASCTTEYNIFAPFKFFPAVRTYLRVLSLAPINECHDFAFERAIKLGWVFGLELGSANRTAPFVF